MGEYRRFVAYVYEYQKGKKGRNCGFIQVEAKERNCRIELHLLCPGLTPGVKCEIFGFVRNAGLMDGILIGSCITKESRADCVLETDRESMGGSGKTLEKIGGMILITENGAFFGTEWDDKPIRPENFRRMEQRKESEEVIKEKNPNKQEEKEKQSESPVSLEKVINQEAVNNEEAVPENVEEERSSETECKISENPSLESEIVSQAVEEHPVEEKEWTQVPFSFGEPVEAFDDGEIYDCKKIQPRDLYRLQPRDCTLRNNRFLQYGFYNFGHLLLGRNSSGHYILGVPGGYDQQEKFMANMFGFPYFRESRQIRLPKSRGGYWYRLINPPKLY